MDDWLEEFEAEATALKHQLERGDITQREYDEAIKAAWLDMRAEADRKAVIGAGRGHLVI